MGRMTATGTAASAAWPARPVLVRPVAMTAPEPALPKSLWWVFAAYVFLLPVQLVAGDFNVAPSDLFIFLFLLFGFGRLRFPRRAWSLWHAALLLVFTIGTFISGLDHGFLSKFVYLNKGFGIVFLFLSYAMMTSVASDWSTVRPMLRIFIWAVVLHVVAGSLVLFLGPRVGFNPVWMNFYQGRLSGMLIDPNAFGGLVLVALAVHASTFFGERPIIRGWAGLFCTVTLAAGLLLTLSRSAWMGFGLALLFSIPFRPRMIVAYLAIGLVALGVLWISLGSGERSEVLRAANRPETAEQRLTQIRQAIPMIADHPIFGVGIAGFLDEHGWIIHDTTVWMATEFGLVGLGVFLGFMAWFLLRGLSAYRWLSGGDRDLIVGLMCAHVGMWGVSFGIEAFYQRHWWLAMALLASSPVSVVVRRVRGTAPRSVEAAS